MSWHIKHTSQLITCLSMISLLAACNSVTPVRDSDELRIGSLPGPVLPPHPAITINNSRQAAILHYEKFLSSSTESILTPEALRRLADLYLAQEQQELLDGNSSVDTSTSKAAVLYQQLLTRFPDYPHREKVLYQQARAYEQAGDLEQALIALNFFATNYSQSDMISEVQFRRGEHLFVLQDYPTAEQAYQAVTSLGKDSPFYRQALYKLGWSRFKQAHYQSALDAYIQLLDATISDHNNAANPTAIAAAEQERLSDTLRAVSLSFVNLGDSTRVAAYFERIGTRQYEPLVYANLAGLYLSKERYSDAAETFSRFTQVHPRHLDTPMFQSSVIDVYKQAGFNARLLDEKQIYVERFQPASSFWANNTQIDPTEIFTRVQQHLDDITQYYHAAAQRNKTDTAFDTASYWYQFYLSAFPDNEQTAKINFLYAELLTTAGRHGLATKEYQRTAYNYTNHDKAAEAGYAALLASAKHEAILTSEAHTEWHELGIKSAIKFAQTFPNHKQSTPVLLRTAQQLFKSQNYNRSIKVAAMVADKKGITPQTHLEASTIIAHAHFELADYATAEKVYQKILARNLLDPDQRSTLADKLAASIYKQGEMAQKAGDTATATTHFLRIAKLVPTSAIARTARYDAAVIYINSNDYKNSITVLENWQRDYPGDDLNSEISRKLATLYRDNGQKQKAATQYEYLARMESNPAVKREAQWTAATLYEESRATERTIAAWQKYIMTYPTPVEPVIEAQARLVAIYSQLDKTKEKMQWQRAIIKSDNDAGRERTDRTRYLAAHAQIQLNQADLDNYQSINLREPLKKNLALKKQALKDAVASYTRAADYGVSDVTTTATYQIAEIYMDFSKALMSSERPSELSTEELEEYDILLEEQAYPFEEKAIEIHVTNLQHLATGTYDRAIRDSLSRLAEILPVRYAKSERSEAFVTF